MAVKIAQIQNPQVESQFRALHLSTYQEYSETNKLARAEYESRLSHQKGLEKLERDAIHRISGLSEDERAKIDRKRQDALKEHIKKVRSQLTERESKEAQSAKRQSILSGFAGPNLISIPVYAARVMAEERSQVAHIPGEHGNPWVLPWNPNQIKVNMNVSSNQYGLCWLARVSQSPNVVDFWFPFLADKTGMWHFLVLVDSFGYYILNTNDSFLLCRFSKVTFDVSLNVYQYFWLGEQKFPILAEECDHGLRYALINEYGQYDYYPVLRADQVNYVFLRVSMTIWADAYGSGCWAEINFKDGAANFIKPLVLFAIPPQ